jgi:UDP-N-acetylglucosamine 1-carboxyvinyltransferase
MLVASLLSDEASVLTNLPILGDTEIAAELLVSVGAKIERAGNRWTVHTPQITTNTVPPQSRRNRIPILAIGPLLARTGEAAVPILGGDAIGPRPVNYHVAALKRMGAEIEVTETHYRARAKKLHGAAVTLPFPSVGATENIILAAVKATGRTVIRNSAIEPEIVDLIQMLQNMGAVIELGTNRTVYIDGVEKLHGTQYRIMPDRNEAVSYACIALATGGDIFVRGARQEDLMTFLNTIRKIGGDYQVTDDGIRFIGRTEYQSVNIETDTHPGYMTDWQQPLVTVLTKARGRSVIHETVYEDRFGYTTALKDMGANIETSVDCWGDLPCRWWAQGFIHSCAVTGQTPLHSAKIIVPDIRAGMSYVIAALTAVGVSELSGIEHLERGYERLAERLQALGARVERSES